MSMNFGNARGALKGSSRGQLQNEEKHCNVQFSAVPSLTRCSHLSSGDWFPSVPSVFQKSVPALSVFSDSGRWHSRLYNSASPDPHSRALDDSSLCPNFGTNPVSAQVSPSGGSISQERMATAPVGYKSVKPFFALSRHAVVTNVLFLLFLIGCSTPLSHLLWSPSNRGSSEQHHNDNRIVYFADAQVIGLDLGSEFVKVALVAAGRPMEIVLNSSSKRKTSHAVSFADVEKRGLGDEGAAHASKRPNQVFLHSNLFLGLDAKKVGSSGFPLSASPAAASSAAAAVAAEESSDNAAAGSAPQFVPLNLQAEESVLQEAGYPHAYYPYRVYADTKRHSLAFQARDGLILPAEMITANFLSDMRRMAAQSAGLSRDASLGAVISVPCRFSQRQRQALRDAAEIAGLYPISFVHHTAAAATQHALDLPLPSASSPSSSSNSNPTPTGVVETADSQAAAAAEPAAEGSSSTKLFVDVGSASVDLAVVRFDVVPLQGSAATTATAGGASTFDIRLLSCETIYGAGGHNLDLGLAELMREAFEKKHPNSKHLLQRTPRALKKLLKQAALSKHVLSANKKTHFSVEGLLTTESGNELDLHHPVDRNDIETVMQRVQLRNRLQAGLQQTLQQARVGMQDIQEVELLGGGWRVPYVQQQLNELLEGKTAGTRLNGDEAMATGAAFIAANSTVTFRVKKYYLTDITPYEYSIKIFYVPAAAGTTAAAAEQQQQENKQDKNRKDQQQEKGEDSSENQQQQPEHEHAENSSETTMQDGLTVKTVTLFPKQSSFGSASGSSKTVSIRTGDDVTVQLLEDGIVLESVAIKEVAAAVAKRSAEEELLQQQQDEKQTGSSSGNKRELVGAPKVSMVFKVDGTGVLAFDRAYATFEYLVTSVSTSTTTTTTTSSTADTAKNSATAASNSAAEKGESNADNSATAPAAENSEKTKVDSDAAAAVADSKTAAIVTTRDQVVVPLASSASFEMPLPLTAEEKQELRQQLREFEAADLQVQRLAEAINKLESFVYANRGELEEGGRLSKVCTEDVRQQILQQLQQEEEFLYSNAKKEGLEKVREKQQALEDAVAPLQRRAAELEGRPKLIERMEKLLSDVTTRLQRLAAAAEEAAKQQQPGEQQGSGGSGAAVQWPPVEKLKLAQQRKEELVEWWQQQVAAQQQRKDTEDPAFTRAEVVAKVKELQADIKAVENAPKPTTTTTTTTASFKNTMKKKEESKAGDSSSAGGSAGARQTLHQEGTETAEKKAEGAQQDDKQKQQQEPQQPEQAPMNADKREEF